MAINKNGTWKSNNFKNIISTTSSSDTSLTLNNTIAAPMTLEFSPSEMTQTGTPTPTSTKAINVVKGNNTITVSNSDNSQSNIKIIHLGDIEYCKMGNYADRIFKNVVGDIDYSNSRIENAWYIKKRVGKHTFVSSDFTTKCKLTTTTYGSKFGQNSWMFTNIVAIPYNSSRRQILCNAATGIASNSYSSSTNFLIFSYTSSVFIVANTKTNILSTLRNQLLNKVFYYELSTPTYTQITGSLTEELEDYYMSYNEETNIAQTNADLPFILKAKYRTPLPTKTQIYQNQIITNDFIEL